MAVITGLVASGYNAAAIKEIFEQHPNGVGQKYHEKGSTKDKYLKHSIRSAKDFLRNKSNRGQK